MFKRGTGITFLYKFLAMDENHFAHLEGIVHPDKYEILTSMTHDDKLHIMGELVTKMDIDGDEDIGTSELSTWIHYVEQARYVSCNRKSLLRHQFKIT